MSRCEICGEPMPLGEEMFKFHGYSGPCPKPPLPKPRAMAVVEYFYRESDSEFWIDVRVDRAARDSLGPFRTATERQRAYDDLMTMMRSTGAVDLPAQAQ